MASGSSTSSVKSVIAVILTIIIVAAALILFSIDRMETGSDTEIVIATARAKVNLKKMYQEVGSSPAKATSKAIAKKPAPTKKPALAKKNVASVPVKTKPAPVKTVSKKAVVATALPTPKQIKAATPTGEKPWAINVASFSKEIPAHVLAKRLTKAGYNTYVTDFLKDSTRWYRVRVGFFTSRDDAVKFGKALGTELKLTSKPWPVRPQWDEISGHITK